MLNCQKGHARQRVYGLNTALNETGATLGPLVIAAVLYFKGSYQTAYALLLISVVLALISLVAARLSFPVPSRLEKSPATASRSFTAAYWIYMVAGACFAAGLMSFELISYHLSSAKLVTGYWIPVLLAFSTGCGVIASLVMGRLYDRVGLPVILGAVLLSAMFAPLVFQNSLWPVFLAMPLWGIGYATQDTLLKAVVAGAMPDGRRNLAFGLFCTGYGVGWLVGGTVSGLLYEHSRMALIAFVVAV